LLSGVVIALTALTSYPFYLTHKMLKNRAFKRIRRKLLPVLDILEAIKDVLLLAGLVSLAAWGIYSGAPLLASLLTFSSLSATFIQNLNLVAHLQYLFQPLLGVLATVAAAYTLTNAALFIPRIVMSAKTGFEKIVSFFKKPVEKVINPASEEATAKTKTVLEKRVTTQTPSVGSPSEVKVESDAPLAENASSIPLIVAPLISPLESIKGDVEVLAQPVVFSDLLYREINRVSVDVGDPLRELLEENFRKEEERANLGL